LPLFASGALRPAVDRVLPFSDARAAHVALAERSHFGKIVLVPER
jgi:NADPH:quinone reductase-like Zn-dependent oxidoreductase